MAHQITLCFSDKQFSLLQGYATEDVRTVEQLLYILIEKGFFFYEDARDLAPDKPKEYYTEDDLKRLESYPSAVVTFTRKEAQEIFDSIKLNAICRPN